MAISQTKKRQVVELMLAGQHWQEATQQVGLSVSESTAYRWVRCWRQEGEAGLSDDRHGHAYKVTPEIQEWLKERCEHARHTPSSKVKKMIKDKFKVEVSRGHINRVIAASAAGLEPEALLETACRELALALELPQAAAALLNK